MKKIEEQIKIMKYGASEVIHERELIDKLKTKKKLIVKAGLDPTLPDLHFGHTVVLNKLKQFQDLGHQFIFLIVDCMDIEASECDFFVNGAFGKSLSNILKG